MKKMLVAFFSASGVTARAARAIAEATGADLFEIEPAEHYTAADLDWTNKCSRSSLEMEDEACRPAISDAVEDMDAYETVFLGFPIWWYVEPRIVDTFLETYDFAGRTVIPFATSGSSGIGGAERRLHAVCPSAAWKEGVLLNGVDAAAWAKSIK